MKNLKTILFALLAIFTLTACPPDPEPENFLNVEETRISFTNIEDYGYIYVYANVDWTASSNESWCKVSYYSEAIRISVEENTSTKSREAIITVEGGGITKRIYVSQEGVTPQPQNYGIDDPHNTESDQPAYSRQDFAGNSFY